MAVPPALMAQLGALLNVALAGQMASQADVAAATAPLATNAQVAGVQQQVNALAAQVAALPTVAQFNALAAQFNALAAQVAAQPTLAQIQAAVAAAVAAALAPHKAPAVAATAAATVQAVVVARGMNNHHLNGVAYAVVPRADGTAPPSWPAAGLRRATLRTGPIAVVNALLNDSWLLPLALPLPVTALDRRNALAAHIGAAGL